MSAPAPQRFSSIWEGIVGSIWGSIVGASFGLAWGASVGRPFLGAFLGGTGSFLGKIFEGVDRSLIVGNVVKGIVGGIVSFTLTTFVGDLLSAI